MINKLIIKKLVKCLVMKGDKYLLLKRKPSSKFFANQWDFPGGKNEFGEDDYACAIRELKEETTLDIENDKIVDEIIHKIIGFNLRIAIMKVKKYSGEIKLSKDHTEYVWVTIKEMEKMDLAPVVKKHFFKQKE